MPSKYGFGNTRKKSPYSMGKAHYGKDQKNPVMLTKAQETLPVNLQKEILLLLMTAQQKIKTTLVQTCTMWIGERLL